MRPPIIGMTNFPRVMKIKSPDSISITDAITEKLESMIVEGVFKPGDTLPPERKLSKDLAISRASLRQALSVLESRGLILSKQGGGNYVCDVIKKSFSDPLLDLIKRHHELKFQVIELRQTLECSAAYFAAQRATTEDKQNIQLRLDQLQSIVAKNQPVEEAKADLELHLAIADASHNAPLCLMLRNIYALLLSEIEENLSLVHQFEAHSSQLHSQHREMVALVIKGDAEGARRVVNEHLELIRDTFVENGLAVKDNTASAIPTT
ncbi:MAG: GntR family transcriptional repressor for pyruvate dehydrogenase complex [Gammaproteobacteria bacterium]|jgi:GntR family transcriptional repressor for pyruvate dehydrogenase complex